ncbi:Putative ATP-binding protein YdiF [Geodia barretti]|uniref:ATP-binding protein YdiF n=1 Tax=Geodia barretti TaxID=519541 RepID=A0AA35T934_GEOBA|nr:Putative ATP-binding protein YdiF [Geodia barretti]
MLLLAEEMETEEAPHLLAAYARIQEEHERLGGYDYEHEINRILGGLGFSEPDFNLPIRVLSGGQKSRATLAKLLLEKPDLLLFDEPTNHLDINGIEWLENYLNIEYNGAVLVVSHDRYFLDKHVFIEHEEDFIRRNIAGQRTREAQGRRKKLDRLEKFEKPKLDAPTLNLSFTPETRGGNDILRCQKVGKAFGDKVIFTDMNFEVYRRDIIGIIGANGTGKTTFFRMILGDEAPTEGEMWVGPTLKFGYYTQELEGLNLDNEIIDEISALRPNHTQGEIRSFLSKFLFSGDDVFKRIGNLSGGEQSRVLLAKLLLANANVLLLDEPTNHLDIPAREALEAALAEYPATLFIISHDRYLLNNLATKLLIFDGKPGGTAELFQGNYAEYVAQQQQALQANRQRENNQETQHIQTNSPKPKSKSKRKQKMKAERLVGSN